MSQEAPGADVRLDRVPLSEAGYLHYRDNATSFAGFAAFYSREVGVALADGARLIDSARATGNLTEVLGVGPAEGRWFSESEVAPGHYPVAVVGERLASEMFGDSSALNKTIDIDGKAATIVGVMPPDFDFPWEETALWTPLVLDESAPNAGNHWLRGVGRLVSGRSAEEAETELESLVAGLTALHPEVYSPSVLESWDFGVVVRDLQSEITREVEPVLFLALLAGLLIFAVCCASASLSCLAAVQARSKELALRLVLGASPRQLTRSACRTPVATVIVAGLVAMAGIEWAAWWLENQHLPVRFPRLGAALGTGTTGRSWCLCWRAHF